MIIFKFLFVAIIANVTGQPCEDNMSIDLTDGLTFSDGSIVKDGMTFPPKYVYDKKVSGETKTFGCPCEIKKCIRKCCPLNSVLDLPNNKTCKEMPLNDTVTNGLLTLSYTYVYRRNLDVSAGEFNFVYGRPCASMFMETFKWYIQEKSFNHGRTIILNEFTERIECEQFLSHMLVNSQTISGHEFNEMNTVGIPTR